MIVQAALGHNLIFPVPEGPLSILGRWIRTDGSFCRYEIRDGPTALN
jgi:hypothetical protein